MSSLPSVAESLYSQISIIIEQSKAQVVRSVNSIMVKTYWEIGKLIVEDEQKGKARAEYGQQQMNLLSAQLTTRFGKGFDERNLRYMRQFYMLYQNWNAVRSELSWTHYRFLLAVENEKARMWYQNETVTENWSTRALERQINSFYYERLLSSQNPLPVKEEAAVKTCNMQAEDVLKDPYVLEFLHLQNRPSYTENELESALLDNMQDFLLELGSGFSFIARQKHLDLDGDHFYIDLVFYNFKLKCFVLIDLKREKLTHQDIGQMDTYVRLYEDKFRAEDDNPTIGLILCSDKNETVARYSVLSENKNLFASKYQLVLPSEETLVKEIEQELSRVESCMTGESEEKS